MSKKFISQRGQFFSPDLIIAVGVFIFTLALFFTSSNSVFARVGLITDQKAADEVVHSVLNSLVFSSGSPMDWDERILSDVNSFGIAKSSNVIDENKFFALITDLNNSSTYLQTKTKLGLGEYDFYLRLVDRGNTEVIGGGKVSANPRIKLLYERIVLYDSRQLILQGIISLEGQ
ncbi:MAG: hypothetical protein WCW44_01485 [archaeon]